MISDKRNGLCHNILAGFRLYRKPLDRRSLPAVDRSLFGDCDIHLRLPDHKKRPLAYRRLIITRAPFHRPAVINPGVRGILNEFLSAALPMPNHRRAIHNGRFRRHALILHPCDNRRI